MLWEYYGLSFDWAFYCSVINLSLVCVTILAVLVVGLVLALEELFPSEQACFVSWRLRVAGSIDQHCGFSGRYCTDLLASPCSPAVSYTHQVSMVLLLAVCLALIILPFFQCARSTKNNVVFWANPSTAVFLLFFRGSVVNPLTKSFKGQLNGMANIWVHRQGEFNLLGEMFPTTPIMFLSNNTH